MVGRFPGFFGTDMYESLLTAARKSSPDILLLGTGVPPARKWLAQYADQLPSAVCVTDRKVFSVFAEKRRRPSQFMFRTGLPERARGVLLPWHWLRLPFYGIFAIKLIAQRIRGN